jgi:hypothetical protein
LSSPFYSFPLHSSPAPSHSYPLRSRSFSFLTSCGLHG